LSLCVVAAPLARVRAVASAAASAAIAVVTSDSAGDVEGNFGSFGMARERAALTAGFRTADMGAAPARPLSTDAMSAAVCDRISAKGGTEPAVGTTRQGS
jgi:hypothetical protein